MIQALEIRNSAPSDLVSIEALYREAFPDEDLVPLARGLLKEPDTALSLVGIAGDFLVGHAIFTRCGIEASTDKVSLLGPLAVASAWQKQGVGSALVREGLRRQRDHGVVRVYVLGDPAYYVRFGFASEVGVRPPYPLPDAWREAWQSIGLGPSDSPRMGTLSVPQAWRQPGLWAP